MRYTSAVCLKAMVVLRRGACVGLGVCFLFLFACKHFPTQREREGALAHYDLGIYAQQTSPQAALYEFEQALALDPQLTEAVHAKAVLFHLSFKRPVEAEAFYREALRQKAGYSQAKVNLGNLLAEQGRYEEAIALYEEVLDDLMYSTPYLARANLGWAYFQSGNFELAQRNLHQSLAQNPSFCLAYFMLSSVYKAQGELLSACEQLEMFARHCSEYADAHRQHGSCLLELQKPQEAAQAFEACVAKATDAEEATKRSCQQSLEAPAKAWVEPEAFISIKE
ncbi:MAG: social motility TPR repeat lipoprotein Tgl [Cystobacterineae bacterium]|nr:social motility TPR repeat lipoprotein Tgl [Cystobacterineae bacterium]